jgi:hypothetical protein
MTAVDLALLQIGVLLVVAIVMACDRNGEQGTPLT